MWTLMIVKEFDKRRYNRGKRVDGRSVFRGIERETNKCLMPVVGNSTKEVLLQITKDCILTGATVISDCWRSYKCLEEEGYMYPTENYSIQFKNLVTYTYQLNRTNLGRH